MNFYFNHLTGLPANNPQDVFNSLMLDFQRLRKRKDLDLGEGIISEKDPREIFTGHMTLALLIRSSTDKDLRRWIYSQFTRHPANNVCNPESLQAFADGNYSYVIRHTDGSETDARSLVLPYGSNCCLLTMPVSDYWKRNSVTIHSSNPECNIMEMPSFYGNDDSNFSYIIRESIARHYQDSELSKVDAKIDWFKNCIGKSEIRVHPEAIERFKELATDEQQNTINLVQKAFRNNQLFPIVADNTLIKSCEGKGNEMTYELRDVGKGIRIYFQCREDKLIIGGLHTKAEGEGKEQSAHINRATRCCQDLH